jgi:hypothetical protein
MRKQCGDAHALPVGPNEAVSTAVHDGQVRVDQQLLAACRHAEPVDLDILALRAQLELESKTCQLLHHITVPGGTRRLQHGFSSLHC